jgi:hypothetical protein
MPFSIVGRSRKKRPAEAPPPVAPLTTVRVTSGSAPVARSLGRRQVDFSFDRVFVPSLVVDHTELVLRQAGTHAHEGFGIWAGTLAGGDAYVSTLVLPRITTGPKHGEISAETTANVLGSLDQRDLVPILQLHSHPWAAGLSETDAIRPLAAVPGFISVIVPDFGYVDLADVRLWSAHEYQGNHGWVELSEAERQRRFVIDDSVMRVD